MSFDHIVGKGRTREEALSDLHARIQQAISYGLRCVESTPPRREGRVWIAAARMSPGGQDRKTGA